MSKKVQYVHSYPNQSSDPATETGRTVFYAKAGGVYARLTDGTIVGPLGSGGAAAANVVTSANATANKITVADLASPPASAVDGDLWLIPDTTTGYAVEPYVLNGAGTLVVGAGKSRVYLEAAYTVESIRAAVNTAPTGASVIVDVNKNGTTLFTTQANRPTISVGTNLSTATLPDVLTFAAGDYFTVDLDQIGSTVAGADLTVTVRLRRT